ncbi:FAD:protein FMN transferase [Sphingomonas sp. J344]|uniref:FAD:protein FMN transferase n=1 Tax=Sphingomonas sp. J344 TaxID=2898434 RepID=UPI0027E31EC8|nr:FAD:protein FMN transferase [Sphingomonas sp. J344]
MGTRWSATIVAPPPGVQTAIQGVLTHILAQMSHWERCSQLSQINAAAPGGWHGIAPEFIHVMGVALDIAARSDGAFDPAIGALVDLWGFGPPGPREDAPSDAAIDAARSAAGPGAIELDAPPAPPAPRPPRAARPVGDRQGPCRRRGRDAVARPWLR